MKLQIQEATGIRKHFLSFRVSKSWNNLTQAAVSTLITSDARRLAGEKAHFLEGEENASSANKT